MKTTLSHIKHKLTKETFSTTYQLFEAINIESNNIDSSFCKKMSATLKISKGKVILYLVTLSIFFTNYLLRPLKAWILPYWAWSIFYPEVYVCVCVCLSLQQFWEAIWECTGAISIKLSCLSYTWQGLQGWTCPKESHVVPQLILAIFEEMAFFCK